MSKGNTFENDLLRLIFNATAIANLADNASSSPLTDLYVSLHTADPGEAGDQTTNEIAYTSYARVAVARSAGGWTRSVSTVSNTALVQFPQCTGGSGTATHFGIGTDATLAGNLILKGALTSSLAISNGIQPQFAAAALTASVD